MMTWGNPPKLEPTVLKPGKRITPEMLAGDSESSHQKALFAWAALSVGKYPPLAFMFAIPNGGLRDIRTASTLKAEGVKSGVPDIMLPYPLWAYRLPSQDNPTGRHLMYKAGCFIEMKLEKYRNRKNGGCSEEQIEFIKWATSNDYYCKVCYTWIEARDTLISYLEGRI
jgi:hypothetical protein